MKIGNEVFNKKAVKTGRMMASWLIANGDETTQAKAHQALGGGKSDLDRLGRRFLASEKEAILSGSAGNRSSGAPAPCWWLSGASAIIRGE